MGTFVLTGGKVVTDSGVLDPGWLAVTDGVISEVGAGEPADAGADVPVIPVSGWLVPGFVDIHCHGGGGAAFWHADQETVATGVRTHRAHGTTTMLASLVSRPVDELAKQTAALAELTQDGLIAGVHLEGPFISSARCGAHDPAVLAPPARADVETLLDAGRGTVRMVTLAPELDGALAAIRQLAEHRVLAAVGHTDATHDQVRAAIEAGATVATHLFNGMRPLHHREPGPIGALIQDERVTVELICDLVHLHPEIVRMMATHAGPQRTVLITDAIAAAGAGDGDYDIGGLAVTVREGVPTLAGADGTAGAIAGSTLTMDRAFRHFVQDVGMGMTEAVAATATQPARLLGLDQRVGALRVGLAADLVVLDDQLQVSRVLHNGSWIQ
ncbi:N-acetylglucosamine-6-phosphate deacetylase [Tamaricihabitans halophyticus]|uniref:N-acetylglucosamine-6-phosphate deacetylase n=1 Tax=Tamaricihabitans halophyticus TaxID=1262583 RepID=A0A4R2QVM2_9PSEU|nr:N-acetylglucosamine-6-phosphate deacetylase [Tamaricihabitans halophyticus]TCP54120.1 N-acetylglucosamine-6-phosphate deacetylase [Tamaricihabitans halophyticus]